jgi:hypothetical protein
MKTKRFLLAAAITMAAAACSADVTAPDAALRPPADAHQNVAAPDPTTAPAPATAEEDDGGAMGSGVGR